VLPSNSDRASAAGPIRRRLQLRLRTLLLAITLLGIWLGVIVERARTQREAVATILELGGSVYYKHQRVRGVGLVSGAAPPGPAWLRRWIGDDYFQTPLDVNIRSSRDSDACVAAAARLAGLEDLSVDSEAIDDDGYGGYYQGWSDTPHRVQGKPLTDRGMESIGRLTGLTWLTIGGAAITDEGLRHLAPLTRLKHLRIWRCAITGTGLLYLPRPDRLDELNLSSTRLNDLGLESLRGMNRLQLLGLGRTHISDKGLAYLSGLTGLEHLGLGETDISDAGLPCLAALTRLKSLGLHDTRITDQGLEHLGQMAALESLDISITSVGDDGLNHLLGLRRLESLDLYSTRVTDAGFARLQSLPNLRHIAVAEPCETDDRRAFSQRFVRFGSRLRRTPVTDAAIERLQQARPKLTVRH
jgi:internalin A